MTLGPGRRLGLALLVALALAVLAAPTASAHAMVERTVPGAESVVATAPTRVAVDFSEPVTLPGAAVHVYDDALRPVEQGVAGHVDDDPASAGIGLRPGLAAGTYTVTWRVVSVDSHPVSGGFRFSIGHAEAVAGAAVPQPPGDDPAVVTALGVARGAQFAGLIGLGGVLVLRRRALCVAAARARVASDVASPAFNASDVTSLASGPAPARARRVVTGGGALLAAGTVAGLALQGPLALGLGPAAALDPTLLAGTAATPYGVLALVRLGLLAVLVAARRRPAVWIVAGVGVALTLSLGGHAGVGSWAALGVASDAAHLVAASTWLGGVAVLAVLLAPRGADPTGLDALLPWFSRWARGAVAVMVVTGVYQACRDVGAPGALVTTAYGWTLLVKVVLVVVLVALGDRARRWVARRHHAPRPAPRRAFALATGPAPAGPAPVSTDPVSTEAHTVSTLRRGLYAEVAVGVAVLGVTSVLVATPRAAEAYAPAVTISQSAGALVLDATADPAHTGPATVHLRAHTPDGAPLAITRATGSLTLAEAGVGPLPVDVVPAPDGSATARTDFPLPGRWAVDVTVDTPGHSTVFRIGVPVR